MIEPKPKHHRKRFARYNYCEQYMTVNFFNKKNYNCYQSKIIMFWIRLKKSVICMYLAHIWAKSLPTADPTGGITIQDCVQGMLHVVIFKSDL